MEFNVNIVEGWKMTYVEAAIFNTITNFQYEDWLFDTTPGEDTGYMILGEVKAWFSGDEEIINMDNGEWEKRMNLSTEYDATSPLVDLQWRVKILDANKDLFLRVFSNSPNRYFVAGWR